MLLRISAPLVGFVCASVGSDGLVQLASGGTAHATTIAGDRSTIVQIEGRLASDGAEIEHLSNVDDQSQDTYVALQGQVAATRAHLAATQDKERAALAQLRTAAVDAYMNSGSTAEAIDVVLGSRSQDLSVSTTFLQAAGAQSRTAVTATSRKPR